MLSRFADCEAVLADPALVEPAVEEVLRYDPPVQLVSRFALRSAEVAGVTIAAGSFVAPAADVR